MSKRIFSVLLAIMLMFSNVVVYAEPNTESVQNENQEVDKDKEKNKDNDIENDKEKDKGAKNSQKGSQNNSENNNENNNENSNENNNSNNESNENDQNNNNDTETLNLADNAIVELSDGIKLVELNNVPFESVSFYINENGEKREMEYILLDDVYSFENLVVGSTIEFHVRQPDNSLYIDYAGTITITTKNVQVIEFEFQKKNGCNLSCGAITIQYSDIIDLTNSITYSELYDGSFTASIVDTDGCVAVRDMTLIGIGIGTAILSIKATGTKQFNAEEVLVPVTIEKKDLGKIKTSQVSWSNTDKIYDANAELSIKGMIQVGIEAIEIEATVLADNPSAGIHSSTISTYHDEGAHYIFELDTNENMGPSVRIRPATAEIYVDNMTVMYGDDAWKKLIAREVPDWENWIHATVIGNEDLQDELDQMSDYTDIRITANSYLPGVIESAILVYAKDPEGSNFHFIANENADVTVLNEYMSDDEVWNRITVNLTESHNVFLDLERIWTKPGGYIKFDVIDLNSIYDRIIFMINEQRYFNGITVPEEYIDGTVQLGNSRYPNILSDSDLMEDGSQPATIPNVIYLDKTPPNVVFDVGTYEGGELPFVRYQKMGYVSQISVEDNESGLASAKYLIVKVDDPQTAEEQIRQLSINYQSWDDLTGDVRIPGTESGYYLILVAAEDNVGNVVISASNGIVIDTSDPAIEILGIKDKVYQTLDFSVRYQDVGGAGIQSVDVVVSDVAAGIEKNIFHVDNPSDSEVYLSVPKQFNSNTILISATITDRSGNSFTASKTAKIDRTAPEVTVSYDLNDPLNEKYFNSARTMTVVFKERNFDPTTAGFDFSVNGNNYSATVDNFIGHGIRLLSSTDSQKGASNYTDDRTNTFVYIIGDSGVIDNDYHIVPKITDSAGNICSYIDYGDSNPKTDFVIDEVKPILNISFFNRNDERFKIGDLYSREPLYASINITERNFNEQGMKTDITGSDYEGLPIAVQTNGKWESHDFLTNLFRIEARYLISATYTDLAGNTATLEPQSVILDWTSPAGKIITETETVKESDTLSGSSVYGTITNKVIKASYQANDTISGLAYVMYAVYNPGNDSEFNLPSLSSLSTLNWKGWQEPIMLSPDLQGVIFMRVVDYAGNTAYINSVDGFITEATPNTPMIDLDASVYYSSNTAFRINVEDPEKDGVYSGLKSVKWYVLKDGAITQSGNYDLELTRPKIKFLNKVEVIDSKLNNSNNVEVVVEAWDYAGNYNRASKKILVDSVPPSVKVSFNDKPQNGRYFNSERTMILKIKERNFDPNKVLFNMLINGTRYTYSINQLTGHGISVISHTDSQETTDERTNTYQIRFGEGLVDIDYDVNISVTDIAGNENTPIDYHGFATTSFTVDKIVPTMEYVFYVTNTPIVVSSISSMPYYTMNKMKAAILVTERNHSEQNLNCQVTGRNYRDDVIINSQGGNWSESTSHVYTLHTFTKDANYMIRADYKDLAGNSVSLAPRYFTVDTTAPTGTLSVHGKDGTKSFTTTQSKLVYSAFSSGNLSISYTSADETSGVASVGFYLYTPISKSLPDTKEMRNFNWVDNIPPVVPNEEAIVYMRVMDHAGNIRYISSEGMIADDKAAVPQITIEAKEMYNQNANVGISVIEPEVNGAYSGLKKVEWSVQRDGVITQSGNFNSQLTSAKVHSLQKTITVDAKRNNSNNVVINVDTEDYAGNTSHASKQVAFDTTAPKIEIRYDNNNPINGKYFNEPRKMTLVFTERNFDPSKAFVNIAINGEMHTMNPDNLSGYGITKSSSAIDTRINSDERTITYTYTFGGKNIDADYMISASITDDAGNETSTIDFGNSNPKGEFTVDQVIPVLTVDYQNSSGESIKVGEQEGKNFENSPVKTTIKITERNFIDNCLNYTVNATDINKRSLTVPSNGTWDNSGDQHNYSQTFDMDGLYNFECTMTDLAGNKVTYDKRYFCVDTTPPTGSITINGSDWNLTAEEFKRNITFRVFTKEKMTATHTSSDATSGVKWVEYYLYHPTQDTKDTFKGLSTEELSTVQWEKWSGTLTLNPNMQVVVYARVTDNAGNMTYINSEDGIIADSVKPGLSIDIEMDSKLDYYNDDVEFKIIVEDKEKDKTYSGLKSVKWSISSNGKLTDHGDYNTELANSPTRVQKLEHIELVEAAKNNSNNVEITVEAEDYSGNSEKESRIIKIDMEKPVVKVSFDKQTPMNKRYYRKPRKATVTVIEENFDEKKVIFDGNGTPGKWRNTGNKHTCSVTFDEDAEYRFGVTATDLAGNKADYSKHRHFFVDTVSPKIFVKYDKTNETGYYNEPRTAVIAVIDKNFYEEGFSYTPKDGSLNLHDWVHKEKTDSHSTMIKFDQDGKYDFKLVCSDLAGNMANEYKQKTFVIDQTPPVIRFTGIKDNSANRDKLNIVIEYTDENFNKDLIQVELVGATHPKEQVLGQITEKDGIGYFAIPDFKHDQNADDLYTMIARVTDLAGNVSEQKIHFSVNRFGSVYTFDDFTKELLDKYYLKEGKPLTIFETNVNGLKNVGITIGVNGETKKLKPDKDYKAVKENAESGWTIWRYEIDESNFKDEGVYEVRVESVDDAGNRQDNSLKDKPITFVIDKSSPNLVVTGIENEGHYEESQKISISVTDNTLMDNVKIMVDNKLEARFNADEIKNSNGRFEYTLKGTNEWQYVEVIASDAAGNESTSGKIHIIITKKQLLTKKNMMIGGIILGAALLGIVLFIIIRRRKNR